MCVFYKKVIMCVHMSLCVCGAAFVHFHLPFPRIKGQSKVEQTHLNLILQSFSQL